MVTTCFCLQPTSHINKGQSHNKGQGQSHNKDYTKGHRGQGQMMAAILDLLRQTHIYMASLVVKVIYTLIDYPVWCQDW